MLLEVIRKLISLRIFLSNNLLILVRRRDWKNSTLKSLFPKDLKYSDLQKLLAYQLSKETMNLKGIQRHLQL